MENKSSTLSLSQDLKTQINLSQRLMMTAHMQQALRLLQIPLLELETFLEEQVNQNPLLEFLEESHEEESEEKLEEKKESEQIEELQIDENDLSILKQLDGDFQNHFSENDLPHYTKEEEEKRSFIENSLYKPPTLYELLIEQAVQTFEDKEELKLAEILIGYIDQTGFLLTPLEEIASFHHVDSEKLTKIIKMIQLFDPIGVGSKSIQESLLIQLKHFHKEKTLAFKIVEHCYEELLHNRIPLIHKKLNKSIETIQKAIDEDIVKLDLHPGSHIFTLPAPSLIPDVSLREEGKHLVVDVNRDYVPQLRLNHLYFKMLEDPNIPQETKDYIKRHVLSAKWLMRNLQQRYSTIERIADFLVKYQSPYFSEVDGKLVPLTMKKVAEELQLHESTIARTVSNKYIDTPRGLLPLRIFFTNGLPSNEGENLSSTTVKDKLLEMIQSEDKKHPFSDETLSTLLEKNGIFCARRTVAKYRKLLGLGNALQRKKY